ncbi:MAG: hypothetical protein WCK98_04215 [bacterium]
MSKNKFLLGVFVVIVIVAGVIIYLATSLTSKVTNSLPGPVEKPDVNISSNIKDMVEIKTKLKESCSTTTSQNFDSKTDLVSQNLNTYLEKINLATSNRDLSAKNYDTYYDEISSYGFEFNTCYTKLNSISNQQSDTLDRFKYGQNQQVLGELQRQYGEIQRGLGELQRQKGELYLNKGK